ncbi:CvpA family protein [Altererythrobacter aquiaggeris]|uniref:CvpA family protein n=1 Tax=Aestuarierythrobacter aquiaggeris TaxID=1898396 RepID=UPI00301B010B
MTGLDIIVLVIVGVAAIGGFMRGFVQEVFSLASWILALFAIHYLHTPFTEWLLPRIGTPSGAAVLAFATLLLIPYAAMKLIAGNVGKASRNSILGPIDRVLGFGFGVIKGMIIIVLGFSVLVLGYDTVWGEKGRPTWISSARSYTFVDSSSKALVHLIEERRERLRQEPETLESPE